MKDSITKFDLEAAFKALDDLEVPTAEGIRANRPALNEIFSNKTKFESLFEEYYDVGSSEELSNAKESREAEIAKAKLARIEKIVDLDAESPEDLLTSYVGKFIIQCPQCMTLFYKAPEDVEESEDDEHTVNVNEVCQHCGNEAGYTLIGKVGEVTPEEAEEYSEAEMDVSEEDSEIDVDSYEDEEAPEETDAEMSEEDFDLDGELEELDLEIEDDEEDDTNESFQITGSTSLTEDLEEDADLEVSADDFEKLIKSPEFQKPISDHEVRTMLDDSEGEEMTKESLNEETDSDVNAEDLTEAGLGKALGKKLQQAGKKIKNSVSAAIDSLSAKMQTREEKADWVLANARKDYENIDPNGEDRRFETFIVIGYAETYTNGKKITMAPSYKNKDLVIGKNGIQEKTSYSDADSIAKGWSMRQGNGPAFIYMAKDANDDKAVFLCEYFQGELENDQLEKYFTSVKKDLEAIALLQKGGIDEEPEEDILTTQDGDEVTPVEDTSSDLEPVEIEDDAQYVEIKASEVEPGMIINDKSYKFTFALDAENEDIETGIYGIVKDCETLASNKLVAITIEMENGKKPTFGFKTDDKVTIQIKDVEAAATTESLNSIMGGLEELQEASLEKLISDSLVEAYKNVANFRLTGCSYLNEKFEVKGKALFTSGAMRELTYVFTEAYINPESKIVLNGLNEKLGANSKFTIIGNVDKDTKTFITESFKHSK